MKTTIGIVTVIILLVVCYHLLPGISQAVTDRSLAVIDQVARDDQLSIKQRYDSLMVMSLNFRSRQRMDLAWPAIQKADSVLPDLAPTAGLLGLYHFETGEQSAAVESWRRGAIQTPEDPNLPYLATLDTAELAHVDGHMLEKMFVDSLVNRRLAVALYHPPDTDVLAMTEQKLRIEGSINGTFILASIAGLVIFLWGIFKFKRRRLKDTVKKPRSHIISIPKPVSYLVGVSSLIKIGHFGAAFFSFFMLGTDLSEFISRYVVAPENLFDLFTTNLLFAGIFVAIVIAEFIRRKVLVPKRVQTN